jgi:8-hydroxy-5-deazaflavin:NADPH oxidoreductase
VTDLSTPIAILGGTGSLGTGLAVRLAAAGYPVLIGSRDLARARDACGRLANPRITGMTNAEAAEATDMIVLAIPLEGHRAFVESIASGLAFKTVVDATVPMGEGRAYTPPPAGSAAAETQELAPNAWVVAAFHTLSAHLCADLSRPLEQDVLVSGNDAAARARVMALCSAIGARGVDAGGLDAAGTIEALAVLLIGLNIRYRRRNLGIRIAHLPADARPR